MMITKYKNIVIKIGSNTLLHLIENNLFTSFVEDVVFVKEFADVTIVTSGAIATARKMFNIGQAKDISQKQAMASIGQVFLMQKYVTELAKYNIHAGQILLTHLDTTNPQYTENLRLTISSLRGLNAIPIINENDTIANDEIKIGDNDTLSARVAIAISADLLILLTDVSGVYNENPQTNPNAKIINSITLDNINNIMENNVNNKMTEFGSGGIYTKIKAGKTAIENGFDAIISNGRNIKPLSSITKENCTLFT